MSDQRDRKLLHTATAMLRNELESRCRASGFSSWHSSNLYNSNTDGYYTKLGRANGAWVELWLDRYPSEATRRLYYGFRVNSRSDLVRIAQEAPREYKPVAKLTKDHYLRMGKRRIWKLKPGIARHFYGKPVSEDYFQKHRFYGIYDSAKPNSARGVEGIIGRAADFVSSIVCSQAKTVEATTAAEVYPELEPRVRREHLSRERSPRLARERKRMDGYRCRVCEMTFEEVYGELGRGFAESHHLHPLSRASKRKKTSVHDLATVCANCHRMLHLMHGREHDLQDLKRRMEERLRTR